MRVIAGSAKGTRLARAPAGVRPVSDRVREGLFSSLAGRVPGSQVLDLYAGTGALGIEALSRGAAHAAFVDQSPLALAAIRDNLARTRLVDRASVIRSDAGRYLDRAPAERPFDLAFLDPPYDLGSAQVGAVLASLGGLGAEPLLSEGATVALTRRSSSSTIVIPLHWILARRLAYGDSVVTLFRSRNLSRNLPGNQEV
jgi:16S rRNA (guanine966-N2)-methyltransferase